jgi:hypothetical protein
MGMNDNELEAIYVEQRSRYCEELKGVTLR